MSYIGNIGERTAVQFAASDTQCKRLEPPHGAQRIGLQGNNPTTAALLIVMVPAWQAAATNYAPPSVADVRGGQWDKVVPAGSYWDTDICSLAYFGCLDTATSGTAYVKELLAK